MDAICPSSCVEAAGVLCRLHLKAISWNCRQKRYWRYRPSWFHSLAYSHTSCASYPPPSSLFFLLFVFLLLLLSPFSSLFLPFPPPPLTLSLSFFFLFSLLSLPLLPLLLTLPSSFSSSRPIQEAIWVLPAALPGRGSHRHPAYLPAALCPPYWGTMEGATRCHTQSTGDEL